MSLKPVRLPRLRYLYRLVTKGLQPSDKSMFPRHANMCNGVSILLPTIHLELYEFWCDWPDAPVGSGRYDRDVGGCAFPD